MDPLEAILASMAAATGNATAANSKPIKHKTKPPTAPSTVNKKRSRDAASGDDDSSDTLTYLPTATTTTTKTTIWNPRVMHKLPPLRRPPPPHVTPAAEIARQQAVRALCAKIKRAGEQMGIAKLPNSTYETWQFTSKLTVAENDPLIPHAGSDYSGLLEELQKAGAPLASATRCCKELTKEAERLLRQFSTQQQTLAAASAGAKKKRVKVTAGEAMHQLTYGSTSVALSTAHFAKLRELFARQQQDNGVSPPALAFESALFSLLLRYDSLDGGGFQAALNEECFDVLLRHFGCAMECFASPLNCRYARFCSAFPDTDTPFGSVGSFFEFHPRAGCFEANPPFIPQLIKRMADHMTALLKAADGPLAFVIVVPAWPHTPGWQQLRASRFTQHHVRIPQKAHGYCEGKQHVRRTRWRVASFDTSVFFWQNARAAATWPVTALAVSELKTAFASKQAMERDALGLRHSGKRVKAAAS